jgi:peptide deformylase
MKSIVQTDNKVLREMAQEVPIKDISSPKIKKVLADMKELLAEQEDGVAIAAPQIGESLRIFLVSGEVMKKADETYKGPLGTMVYINPVISKLSKDKQEVEEGCLSVRWKYGKILRAQKATVKAYDENGKLFERGASGLLAQVFQHETDHLNGVLFIDSAYDVKDIPPEKQKELDDEYNDHDYADA